MTYFLVTVHALQIDRQMTAKARPDGQPKSDHRTSAESDGRTSWKMWNCSNAARRTNGKTCSTPAASMLIAEETSAHICHNQAPR